MATPAGGVLCFFFFFHLSEAGHFMLLPSKEGKSEKMDWFKCPC